MLRSVLRPTLLAIALGGLAAPAWTTPGGFVDAFESGLRWIHGASLSDPWVPGAVSFAAGGDLVWTGGQGANRKLLLLATPESGVVAPVYRDPAVAAASHILGVASGAGGERLFSLAHYPEPDLFSRRTVVARHSALQLAGGDTFSAEWSAPFPFVANGPSLFAVDEAGEVLVAAAFNNQAGSVHLRWLDGMTGSTLRFLDLPGSGLDALAFSADGQRTALSVGARLLILGPTGNVLHNELLGSPATTLAFDAHGSRLVAGRLAALHVYDFNGTSYQLTHTLAAGNDEVASKVAVSADGTTYATAWWKFRAVDELRFEVYDGASHAMLNQVVQVGYSGSLQNSPVGVDMTADGSRIVFAAWGRGDNAPEVVLLQRGQAQAVLEVDLPGSAMGVALDHRGTSVAVVTKSLHANQFGSTGEVRLYRTGEQDVEMVAPARLGGQLEVASREPGSSFALFLVGERALAPTQPAGTLGDLWLVRNQRLQVTAIPADAQGEALLTAPIPGHAGLLGLDLSVQVANRVNGQVRLSETVLDPLFY